MGENRVCRVIECTAGHNGTYFDMGFKDGDKKWLLQTVTMPVIDKLFTKAKKELRTKVKQWPPLSRVTMYNKKKDKAVLEKKKRALQNCFSAMVKMDLVWESEAFQNFLGEPEDPDSKDKNHHVVFEKRPLGFHFTDNHYVSAVQPSTAGRLGVKRGWLLTHVNDSSIEMMNFDEVFTVLSKTPLPLKISFIEKTKKKRKGKVQYVWKKTEKLKNFYKLGRQLGEPGQFGVAKECIRKSDNKRFAVKIIDKSKFLYEGVEQVMEDMKTEIHMLRELRHPNILRLFDVYEDSVKLYLVQEFCGGGELFDRITKKGYGSERQCSVVLKQLLEGIAYMHTKNIVHADLKPGNFLFLNKKDDSPMKIIDFGMAKKVGRERFLYNMCGTPYYTAPEVIAGRYHTSADVWSIGVIMFVMMFGYPPFYVDPGASNQQDQIYKKILKGFTPITKDGFGRHFPKSMKASDLAKDLMKNLLRKEVAKRYTAAQALDHPWFKKASSENTISKQVLDSITKFTKRNKLRLAVVHLFKDAIDPNQQKSLKETFEKMDEDGDGTVSLAEFQKHMSATSKMSKAEITNRFKAIDIDGDAQIDFNELLTSVSDFQLEQVPERMYNIFKSIDKDGDGQLSAEELEGALKNSSDYDWFEKLNIDIEGAIKAADKDGDGQISFKEFVHAFAPTRRRPIPKEDDEKEEDDDVDTRRLLERFKSKEPVKEPAKEPAKVDSTSPKGTEPKPAVAELK